MPFLSSISTALPPYELTQPAASAFARHHFAAAFSNIERYLPVFEHAQIDSRYLVVPPEWFLEPRSFGVCNDLFCEWAVRLGEEVAWRCLHQVGLLPHYIDHLLFVSTTGLAAPNIDAHLINRLGLGIHTRRTPIWGLGCAGGVAGLARAYEYTRAYPTHRALLVNIELCSITFQWGDMSKRNIIAASLFGDGAAAVLVEGDEIARQPAAGKHALLEMHALEGNTARIRILGSQSTLWPDSLQVMGWDIVDTGMQVVFSSRIPSIVQELMHANVSEFLTPYGLRLDDIGQFILHPGGAKVIRAYEQALQIDPERLHHTRDVLRRYGNMSSATVFFVLEAFQQATPLGAGEYGLLAVLGPGFSCELALIQVTSNE